MPQWPRVAAKSAGEGSGCRPVPGRIGADRSLSTDANSAPGMCPPAYAASPHCGLSSSCRQSMMRSRGAAASRSNSSASTSGANGVLSAMRASSPLQFRPAIETRHAVIDVYWSANSPFCWRVLLTLELKGLAWRSHPMQTDLQEHKAPQMLAMNPRGRLPVVKDGDYVVFESLAVLYYLDRKYPSPPIFGRSAEEGGVIMRVINEFQAY